MLLQYPKMIPVEGCYKIILLLNGPVRRALKKENERKLLISSQLREISVILSSSPVAEDKLALENI